MQKSRPATSAANNGATSDALTCPFAKEHIRHKWLAEAAPP